MNERMLVALLTAIQFTHMVDFVLMMPLGPQLQRELPCTPGAFSVLVASYTISAGVAAAIAGLVIDRFDRKRALLALYLGLTLATAACGLCHHYGTLMLARMAAGACGGMLGSLIMTIIGERIPYERRGAATGAVMAAFSLASMLGIPFGTWLARHGGWETPFLTLAGLSSLVFIGCSLAMEPMTGHLGGLRRNALAAVKAVLSQREHWRAYTLTIALTFAGFTVIPLLATYLVLNVGIGEANVAWFYGIGGATTAITGPLIGKLADRWGKHKKRRELVELKNRVEATMYESEKSLKEHGSKISDADREAISNAKKKLEEAVKGDEKEPIEAALSELQTAMQKIGEVLYAEAAKKAGQGEGSGGASSGPSEGGGKRSEKSSADDVQDAEFEVKS